MSEKSSEEKREIIKAQDVEVEKDEECVESEAHVEAVVHRIIQSEFSGPIPPPNIIKRYEEVLPGAADRIFSMAEKQSNHRQSMEEKMIHAESRDGLLGVLFAFILGLGCIIAAVIIVIKVPQNSGAISGAALGATGIISIIATFIKSTRANFHNTKNTDSKDAAKDDSK